MINLYNYFMRGQHGTLRVKNGANFSYKGPWKLVYPDTVLDEWFVGDFMAAEYTIVADFGDNDKEIIKCIVIASPERANLVIYGRTNLGRNLLEITAEVNASTVKIIVNPAFFDDSTVGTGSKVIFSANYFYTQNDLGT